MFSFILVLSQKYLCVTRQYIFNSKSSQSLRLTAFLSRKEKLTMQFCKDRGNRIRASDKSLTFRFSAGSLLLLFLVVVILLNLKTILTTDWKSVSFLKDGSVHLTVTPYMIVTVIVSALVCVIATLLYQRFQYDRGETALSPSKAGQNDT